MRLRPVAPRARRIAESVASVPEFTMRTISQLGTMAVIASAIVTSSGFGTPKERPSTITSRTASSTSSRAWPAIIGPQLPM